MCIDSTEVTRAQYEQFVLWARAEGLVQPPYCAWNTSFEPEQGCISDISTCQGPGCVDHPIVCVDWCDAVAYCHWAGKRLCGAIDGGHVPDKQWNDQRVSQWMNACSAGTTLQAPTQRYAYGSTFEPVCNEQMTTHCQPGEDCTTHQVRSNLDCQAKGVYQGVYDLSGNVREWEDSCLRYKGMDDLCRVRGGSFEDGDSETRCASDQSRLRGQAQPDLGFRCCGPVAD